MAWYDSSWSNRLALTVDYTKVDADLTDFPVYLDLGQIGSGHGFWTNVQTDGDDIRITKSDETTEVPVEIVSIDTTGKTGEVHFLADGTLSSTVDTVYYVYYGNAGASRPAVSATYGAQNVFNSDYSMALHMTGAAYTDLDDSTANDNDVAVEVLSPNYNQPGKLGKAVDFSGSNSHLKINDANSLDFGSTDSYTVSAWLKVTGGFGSTRYAMQKWESGSSTYPYLLGYNTANRVNFYIYDGSKFPGVISTLNVTNSNWHLYHGVRDVANDKVRLYVDGVENGNTTDTTTASFLNSAKIGIAAQLNSTPRYYFPGSIEEPRIVSAALSADWIATEYNNQNAPSTFYAIGAEEDAPSAGGVSSIIIID